MPDEQLADKRTTDEPGREALSVLRGIWTAQRQSAADLDAPSSTKVCKNMKNIGFGGLTPDGGADGGSTAGPVGEDLRSAWRDRLAREGKLVPGSTTLREMIMGEMITGAPEPPA